MVAVTGDKWLGERGQKYNYMVTKIMGLPMAQLRVTMPR
jgi:hypothetical protein